MKLIDILARELKVWPEGAVAAVQQSIVDGRVSFIDCIDVEFSFGQWDYIDACMRIHEQKDAHQFERASDWKSSVVTHAEWQAAVDALKVAEGIADAEAGNLIPLDDVKAKWMSRSWDGKGYPPEGIECDYESAAGWITVTVFAVKPAPDSTLWIMWEVPGKDWGSTHDPELFRPVRTAEQIAAESWDRLGQRRDDYLKAIDAGYRKQVTP